MMAIMQLPDRISDINRLSAMLPEVLQSIADTREPAETGGNGGGTSDAWCQ
jgi:hypothetical protein